MRWIFLRKLSSSGVSLAFWRSLSSWMKAYSRKFVIISALNLCNRDFSMISFSSCHFPSSSNSKSSSIMVRSLLPSGNNQLMACRGCIICEFSFYTVVLEQIGD